jgi:methionine synthase II (cobalamin-independent)
LDLGSFALKPHRKHFCGNCGCDSTWSKVPIVSTPLKTLYDQFARNTQYKEPDRTLNLDQDKYSGCDYEIWASTPAIVWSAERPQEKGIHVHVCDGDKRIVDDTFSVVVLNGKPLERKEVLQAMLERTIT